MIYLLSDSFLCSPRPQVLHQPVSGDPRRADGLSRGGSGVPTLIRTDSDSGTSLHSENELHWWANQTHLYTLRENNQI